MDIQQNYNYRVYYYMVILSNYTLVKYLGMGVNKEGYKYTLASLVLMSIK